MRRNAFIGSESGVRSRPRSGSRKHDRDDDANHLEPMLKGRLSDRSLTAGNILRLQQLAGNAGTASFIARLHALPSAPLTVQRKRKYETIPNEEKGFPEGEEDDYEKRIIKHYDASLDSGNKLKDRGVDWYTKLRPAEAPVTTETTEDQVRKAGYKDFWIIKRDDKGVVTVTVCTSRGSLLSADEASREIEKYTDVKGIEDDQDFLYTNMFNVSTGEFTASCNDRDSDKETAQKDSLPPALNNSEIIWHQHMLARRVAAPPAPHEPRAPAPIRSIEREQISNEQTLDTIFLCDRASEALKGEWVTLDDPAQDDVWALLGTPNGNSAVWLLIQHGREEGHTDIKSVSYTKDGLKIHYLF